MSRQHLVPGVGFVLEDGSDELLLPGVAYLNETDAGAVTGTVAGTAPTATQSIAALNVDNNERQFFVPGIGFAHIYAGDGQYLIPGGAFIAQDVAGEAAEGGTAASVVPSVTQAVTGTVQSDEPAVDAGQFYIPGVGYFLQNGETQFFIPGAYVIQAAVQEPGEAGTISQTTARATQSVAAYHGITGDAIVTQVLGTEVAQFICDAVTFDGVNDYIQRGQGLFGVDRSSKLMFSTLFRRDTAPEISEFLFAEAGDLLWITLNTSGQLEVMVASAAALFAFRTTTNLCDGDFKQVVISIDTDFESGDKVGQVLINGTLVSTVVLSDAYGAFEVPLAEIEEEVIATDWIIGAGDGGINKFTGDLAEVWFDASVALDLTDSDNVEQFWQNGTPRSFGSDGSTPLSTQPLIYLHLGDGEAVANFAVNRGSGGILTLVGALVVASQSPTPGELAFFSNITQSLIAAEVFDADVAQTLSSISQGLIASGLDLSTTGTIAQTAPSLTHAADVTHTTHHIATVAQTAPMAVNRASYYDFLHPPVLTYGAAARSKTYERKVRAKYEEFEEIDRRIKAKEAAERESVRKQQEAKRQLAELQEKKRQTKTIAERRRKLEARIEAYQSEIIDLRTAVVAMLDEIERARVEAELQQIADRRRRMFLLIAAAS
jgi:hypothetical protein